MDEARDHMAVVEVVVVVRAEDVGRDDRRKLAAVLLVVQPGYKIKSNHE